MSTSDKALIVNTIIMIIFIAIMIGTFWKFQSVPDSLIYCVLGSGAAENGCLAWVYHAKQKRKAAELAQQCDNSSGL